MLNQQFKSAGDYGNSDTFASPKISKFKANIYPYMAEAIHNSFADNKSDGTEPNAPLEYFTKKLLGTSSSYDEEGQFAPDINGYTFAFLMPPDLSGYAINKPDFAYELSKFTKLSCFLIMDFTPPAVQVIASEIPARSGAIQFSSEVQSYGQMNITFMDNQKLTAFGLHRSWVQYIEDITRGSIEPNPEYIELGNEKFGQLDYATSAYIIRFKPTTSSSWGDIIYIGKAIGIFPINMPDKEVIGRRDSNELTMLPFSYSCALYRQLVYGAPAEESWLWKEFVQNIQSQF